MTQRGIFRTVTFKLTLGYLLLFTLASFLVFLLTYLSLSTTLRIRMDNALRDEMKEFETLLANRGIRRLEREFINESKSNGISVWFYVLLSPRGHILAASDLGPWRGVALCPKLPTPLRVGQEVFKTLPRQGNEHKVRVIYKKVRGGNILEIGHLTRDNDEILERVEDVFVYGFLAMLAMGALLGWLVSKRAMAGVERVTQTALKIDRGDLSRRVPVGKEGREIEDLTRAFNHMLDRIQILVKDLEEVTQNIAHDLRSPLTRIRGLAENALSSTNDLATFREVSGMVIEECDQLLGMIHTMLAIAQADSGLSRLLKAPVDLKKVARDMVDLFQPAAEDKGMTFRMTLPSHPVHVLGDEIALKQVAVNLLDNAIKFSKAGDQVEVSVKTENAFAILEIRDTGMGIEAGDLPHIFNRFYRGDKSRSTPGNGLGLSLALSLIRAHGGKIDVESALGKGSTFRVYLPRHIPPSRQGI